MTIKNIGIFEKKKQKQKTNPGSAFLHSSQTVVFILTQ